MSDDGHVLRSVSGAQPGEVVVEDNVEDPVEPVFDAPMGAHGQGENLGIKLGGAEIVTPLASEGSVSFDPAFDHGDHSQMGKAGLVRVTARGEEPVDIIADKMAALFDAAVIGIGRDVDRFDLCGFRVGEELDHIVMENRSIGLEGEQIVAPARHDPLCNLGLGSHGVDGDERALQFELLQKRGDGADFVGLFLDRLLTQDQALSGGPGADHVQRRAAGSVRRSARRLS